jgi:GNAT superfamily N-acetyltransferase
VFFYRYRVAERHLNRYAGEMHQRYLAGKTEKVATAGRDVQLHKFYDREDRNWIYFALDMKLAPKLQKITSKPYPPILGFISMTKLPRWAVYETNMIYVSPAARGQGMATVLYDAVMRDGVMVMSGYSHNPKSRRLWMKLVSDPKYTTWAHDIVNLDRYSDLFVEEDNFQCQLKLYEDIKKMRRHLKEDVRIIAFNPRYLHDHPSSEHREDRRVR